MSRPYSFMQGHKGGIFSKATDWKPLFLIKIKTKQNLACLNKERNVIFEHIRQNVRVFPRTKSSALNNNCENITAYWEKSKQSEVWVFVPSKKYFQRLKWYKKFFLLIWTFLLHEYCQLYHKLDSSLSPKNIICLKDYPPNLTKYEVKGTSKIPISKLCSELGKI